MDFYSHSGTIMSNFYTVGSYKRISGSEIEGALIKGITVTSRPANQKELLWAYEKLNSLNASKQTEQFHHDCCRRRTTKWENA